MNDTYLCCERAIITGTNAVVDQLNAKIPQRLDGEVVTLHSATRLASDDHGHLGHLLTEEFLHSLKSPGVPEAKLLVMRNISIQDCIMNNTKVIAREFGRKFVMVETLLNHRHVLLTQIVFRFTLLRSGVTVEGRQFPL